MMKLRPSRESELELFMQMERQEHASRFVNSTDLAGHQKNFASDEITYLSIINEMEVVMGYFILVNDSEHTDVEFRRIVIDQNHRGVGQHAIRQMERYCSRNLDARGIWLDVYEDNIVGKHVYEKLGYKKFKEDLYQGRRLLFYRKTLPSRDMGV